MCSASSKELSSASGMSKTVVTNADKSSIQKSAIPTVGTNDNVHRQVLTQTHVDIQVEGDNTMDGTSIPGTIGISGRMSKSLRGLLTTFLVFTQDEQEDSITRRNINSLNATDKTNKSDEKEGFKPTTTTTVVSQEFSKESLINMFGDDPQQLEESFALQKLNLGGTELISMNGESCKDLPLDVIQEKLILLEGDFSLVFLRRPTTYNCWHKEILILKPSIIEENEVMVETEDTITAGTSTTNFWSDIQCEWNALEVENSDLKSVSMGNQELNHASERSNSSSSRVFSKEEKSSKMLCLGHLVDDESPAWIKTSPLREGDQILMVNGKSDIQELHPTDATLTIGMIYQCGTSHITIVVKTPPSKRNESKRWSLRKSAVAVGGGVMMGAGAVLMVTPLHPIGHAMAIGGVGLLGSEFEKPRQAASRAKKMATSIRNSLHERRKQYQQQSSSDIENNNNDNRQITISLDDGDANSNVKNPQPPVGRFRQFFNRQASS